MTRPEGERIAALEAIMVRVEKKLDGIEKNFNEKMTEFDNRLIKVEISVGARKGSWLIVGGLISAAAALGAMVDRFIGWFAN